MLRTATFLVVLSLAATAADKPARSAEASDETVAVEATLYSDPESVTKLLGRDPGFPMVVVEVKVRPQGDEALKIWHDDFTLLSNKDGQRCQAMSPSQLAGSGAIKVEKQAYRAAMGVGDPNRPVYPDVTGTGRPRSIGSQESIMTQGDTSKSQAHAEDARSADPLLDVLKARLLPQGETKDEKKGLLYFVLDGKHKAKQLELIYKPEGRRFILDFDK